MSMPLRLLLVEDNPGDVVLVREALREVASTVSLTHVSSLAESRHELAQSPDAVLLDLNLPDSTGLDTVPAVRQIAPHTPLVVLTGLADEHTGLEAVRLGAQDYLVKGRSDGARLMQAVRYAIERQHAEDRLVATATALEASNRALEEFASIASHDLRDPIAKILALSHLLTVAGTLSPDDTELAVQIRTSAQHMKELVDALLGYGRSIRTAAEFSGVSLAPVVDDVLSDLGVRIAETNAVITVGPLPRVSGDAVLLRQLLQNLIGNALKFRSPERRPQIAVSAVTDLGTRTATIQIRDNGVGFSDADGERIFKPFVQLGAKRTDGNGLGLAICRRIVDAHGGAVRAHGVPGEGATFSVTLPLADTRSPVNRGSP